MSKPKFQAGDTVECLGNETYGAFRDMTVGQTYIFTAVSSGYAVWRDDVGDRCSYDISSLAGRFRLVESASDDDHTIRDYLEVNNILVTTEQAEIATKALLAFARSLTQ